MFDSCNPAPFETLNFSFAATAWRGEDVVCDRNVLMHRIVLCVSESTEGWTCSSEPVAACVTWLGIPAPIASKTFFVKCEEVEVEASPATTEHITSVAEKCKEAALDVQSLITVITGAVLLAVCIVIVAKGIVSCAAYIYDKCEITSINETNAEEIQVNDPANSEQFEHV